MTPNQLAELRRCVQQLNGLLRSLQKEHELPLAPRRTRAEASAMMATVRELHAQGLTQKDIAAKLGLTRDMAAYYIHRRKS
jgi:DNA-binding NarL/FixJ family response regulator